MNALPFPLRSNFENDLFATSDNATLYVKLKNIVVDTYKVSVRITFRTRQLQRVLSDRRKCRVKFGERIAHKVELRLDALVAAKSLADFFPPNARPERCHELKGTKLGVFSMDLAHPYRLLFVSSSDYMPSKDNVKLAWKSIRSIEIIAIEDTHG